MIALAYAVGHIAEAVLRVDIAHQTLLLTAVRTADFTGLMARQAFTF